MAPIHRELQKYEVVESGSAWSVVAVDADDQRHLVCEFENPADAARRAERLNRKIEARNSASAVSREG